MIIWALIRAGMGLAGIASRFPDSPPRLIFCRRNGRGRIWSSEFQPESEAFTLYSATSLTATNAAAISADLPPVDWANSRAEWTDLNAPVAVNGITHYPIFDPESALGGGPRRRPYPHIGNRHPACE